MRKQLIEDLNRLTSKEYIDKKTLQKFIERVNCSDPIIREQNQADHICVFYLPIHKEIHKTYLIIHRKSGLWMSPGGHVDDNETPIETVRRECNEELNFSLSSEPIELVNITIDPIENKVQQCKMHYTLWYTVSMKAVDFVYNTQESVDGKWVTLEQAKKLVTFPTFIKPIASLSAVL